MDLQAFKNQNNFSDLAAKIGYPRVNSKECPKCHRKSTFSIRNETYYKCFHPNCELNESGDIFNFAVQMGVCATIGEAIRKIAGSRGNTDYQGHSERLKQRHKVMSTVFRYYKDQLEVYDEPKKYIQERGYGDLKDLDVGYAPDSTYDLIPNIGDPPYKISSNELEREQLVLERSGMDFIRNRLVFPIRDSKGHIIHFHSRSLDPAETEKKWLATRAPEGIKTNVHYAWAPTKFARTEHLFITEGISDGLSLLRLGMPVISALSIMSDFNQILREYKSLKTLIAIYDNDQVPIGQRKADSYKSWEHVLPRLIEYQKANPKIDIWCVVPPSRPGVKDVNEWLQSINYDVDTFNKYVQLKASKLSSFSLNYYINRPQDHIKLLELIKYGSDPNLSKMVRKSLIEWIQNNYPSFIDYLIATNL